MNHTRNMQQSVFIHMQTHVAGAEWEAGKSELRANDAWCQTFSCPFRYQNTHKKGKLPCLRSRLDPYLGGEGATEKVEWPKEVTDS